MRICNLVLLVALLPAAVLARPAAAPSEEHPVLHDIVGAVSAERIESDIRKLVSFGTRHTLSETESDDRGIGAARRWIEAEFARISEDCGGCLEVVIQSDTMTGEEQGLFGGQIMAREAVEKGWRVEAVLNNDMIGNIHGINGVADNTTARIFSQFRKQTLTADQERLMRFTGGEVDSPSRNLARYIDRLADRYIPNLDTMMVYRLDRFRRGGHHKPFNDVGFPGVRIMETNEHYDQQHQDLRTEDGIEYGDTIDHVEFDFAAKLTALNAVALASLAWAPPPPAGVEIEGAVSPDTTLSWEKPGDDKAPDLAGYRVHWRPTAASQWSNERWVGNVAKYTLDNIVIDNYCFGVSSVTEDGFESPVVFPGAAGSFSGYEAGNGVLQEDRP